MFFILFRFFILFQTLKLDYTRRARVAPEGNYCAVSGPKTGSFGQKDPKTGPVLAHVLGQFDNFNWSKKGTQSK